MENDYVVYMHKNKINSKKYIGATRNIKTRFGKDGNNYKGQPFYKEIKKYGWNNFEHLILYENLTADEANQKEIEMINKYNTTNEKYGYNINSGGFIAKKNKYYCFLQIYLSKDKKEKLKRKANEKGLTLAAYIRMVLIESLQKE